MLSPQRRRGRAEVAADDVSLSILRLAWRLDSLDKWRDRVDKRLDDLDAKVDGVVNAQTIAEAVTDELEKRKTFEWSTLSKLGATVAGLVVVAESVKGLLGL